jgi:hypothetical protein
MAQETRVFTGRKLNCLYYPAQGVQLPINLAPSTVFLRGRLLGQVTNSANEVQTLTVTGTPTGGSITVTMIDPLSLSPVSFVIAYNATNAVAQAAARAVLGPNVTVTGGALPGTPLVFTATGDFVNLPIALMTVATNALTGGTTPAASFARTTTGRTKNTYANYVGGNSDGTEVARCILDRDCATDAGGNITWGPSAVGGYAGDTYKSTPAWFRGFFDTKEILGLDAAAVVELGRLWSGTVADGVLSMY